MKPCLVKLTLIASCALLGTHAFAQTSAKPPGAAATTPASAAKAQAANVKAAVALSAVTQVSAAGSVIVLADGIVANAAMAQMQPPADGFVYER